MTPMEELQHLFVDLFGVAELRLFLALGPGGEGVAAALPHAVGAARLAGEAVLAMRHRGLINDGLFDRLELARPNRADAIGRVRGRWREDRPERAFEVHVERDSGVRLEFTTLAGVQQEQAAGHAGRWKLHMTAGVVVDVRVLGERLSVRVETDGPSGLTGMGVVVRDGERVAELTLEMVGDAFERHGQCGGTALLLDWHAEIGELT